jgi:hypothetical protein
MCCSEQLDKGKSDSEEKERLRDLDNNVPRPGLLCNYCVSIPFLIKGKYLLEKVSNAICNDETLAK